MQIEREDSRGWPTFDAIYVSYLARTVPHSFTFLCSSLHCFALVFHAPSHRFHNTDQFYFHSEFLSQERKPFQPISLFTIQNLKKLTFSRGGYKKWMQNEARLGVAHSSSGSFVSIETESGRAVRQKRKKNHMVGALHYPRTARIVSLEIQYGSRNKVFRYILSIHVFLLDVPFYVFISGGKLARRLTSYLFIFHNGIGV